MITLSFKTNWLFLFFWVFEMTLILGIIVTQRHQLSRRKQYPHMLSYIALPSL